MEAQAIQEASCLRIEVTAKTAQPAGRGLAEPWLIDCMAVYRALVHWGSDNQLIMREDPQVRPVQVLTKGLANAKV